MIPKIIHYCWFGGKPLNSLSVRCIKSWRKQCNNYEIREWNENNFDIKNAPLYVKQAYQVQKWAFVSDYVRLWAMVNCGGIYLDTDVQVLKNFDNYLHHIAFAGKEKEGYISTGVMGCQKGYSLFKEILHYYNKTQFIINNTYNTTTNVKIITEFCRNKGYIQDNTYQEIEGFALYPRDYFSPIILNDNKVQITQNTITIHWFAGSWIDQSIKKEIQLKKKIALKHTLRRKRKLLLRKIIHRIVTIFINEKKYQKIKSFFKL